MTETAATAIILAENLLQRFDLIVGQPVARHGLLAGLVHFMADTAARMEALEARVRQLERGE